MEINWREKIKWRPSKIIHWKCRLWRIVAMGLVIKNIIMLKIYIKYYIIRLTDKLQSEL